MKYLNLIFILLIFSCSPEELQERTPANNPCFEQIGDVLSVVYEIKPKGEASKRIDKYRASNGFTCDIKILYDRDSLQIGDTLIFTRDYSDRIGNAHYLLFNKDSNFYEYYQINETYKGVLNNDGVCNDTVNNNFPFSIEFTDCDTLNIDTLYITRKN